jgi:PilZ domain
MTKAKKFGQKGADATLAAATQMSGQKKPKSYLELRKAPPRERQLKTVQIIFNNGYSTYNAILRDVSEGGARIETKHVLDIPDVFTLKFTHDNTVHQCSLIWRGENEIGIQFIPV